MTMPDPLDPGERPPTTEVTQFAWAELAPRALSGHPELGHVPSFASAQQAPWHCKDSYKNTQNWMGGETTA